MATTNGDGTVRGWKILGDAIAQQGFPEFFFIMGGPILDAASAAIAAGSRAIDVRHETAAVMAAHAAARMRRRPALCMAASGPAAANLAPGLANALVDGAPVIAIGGASARKDVHRGGFQEFDQFALMRSVVKHAEQIHDAHRIPERLHHAARIAMTGRQGPVYLELPGDVLYAEVTQTPEAYTSDSWWPVPGAARDTDIDSTIDLLADAKRPLLLAGAGILWSDAGSALQAFAEAVRVPVYTTPQVRGALPEDHELALPAARSLAFREADLLIIVGTRMNYVWSHFGPPRFRSDVKIVQIDADPSQIATAREVDLGIVADAKSVLTQLNERARQRGDWSDRFAEWLDTLTAKDRQAATTPPSDHDESEGVHPVTLCAELRDLMRRDDVLVVDGQDILAFARQSIPIHQLGNHLTSGTFGTMGVGVPYGIGAKAARPNARVIVLTGDGALGFSGMELDTVARHGLNMTVIVSLNGGHTADPDRKKPGRNLGYTNYHDMARALGWNSEYVTRSDELAQALKNNLDSDTPSLINVRTDWRVRARQAPFTSYVT